MDTVEGTHPSAGEIQADGSKVSQLQEFAFDGECSTKPLPYANTCLKLATEMVGFVVVA